MFGFFLDLDSVFQLVCWIQTVLQGLDWLVFQAGSLLVFQDLDCGFPGFGSFGFSGYRRIDIRYQSTSGTNIELAGCLRKRKSTSNGYENYDGHFRSKEIWPHKQLKVK